MPSTLSKPLGVRVPHIQLEQIEELAQQRGVTRGAIATEALCRGLDLIAAEFASARNARGKRKSRAKRAEAKAPPEARRDLLTFAGQVLEAAQSTKSGRFGDDRVFINHVWRQYKREQRPKGMDLEAFKQRLLEANRQHYLSLIRADMAPYLDRKDVQESAIRHLSAEFNFVCI